MQKLSFFFILIACLVSCDHSHNKDCEFYKAIHLQPLQAAADITIIHDTVIVNKTDSHVCGAETKTGKPCKKRTKTQFCHLHTK